MIRSHPPEKKPKAARPPQKISFGTSNICQSRSIHRARRTGTFPYSAPDKFVNASRSRPMHLLKMMRKGGWKCHYFQVALLFDGMDLVSVYERCWSVVCCDETVIRTTLRPRPLMARTRDCCVLGKKKRICQAPCLPPMPCFIIAGEYGVQRY